jgi:hypothetical protein
MLTSHTPVLAAFVTPSLSVASITNVVSLTMIGDIPQLLIGDDDQHSDQIKFRLSDCIFEYGNFRGEPDAQRFEAERLPSDEPEIANHHGLIFRGRFLEAPEINAHRHRLLRDVGRVRGVGFSPDHFLHLSDGLNSIQ